MNNSVQLVQQHSSCCSAGLVGYDLQAGPPLKVKGFSWHTWCSWAVALNTLHGVRCSSCQASYMLNLTGSMSDWGLASMLTLPSTCSKALAVCKHAFSPEPANTVCCMLSDDYYISLDWDLTVTL